MRDIVLFDKVKIKGLDLSGIVGSVEIMPNINRYLIRYFWNGDLKEYWLYPNEFELEKN